MFHVDPVTVADLHCGLPLGLKRLDSVALLGSHQRKPLFWYNEHVSFATHGKSFCNRAWQGEANLWE